MDETDVRLCQMLLLNSRTPFRDLSDKLNISVQAVHKRVMNLFNIGAINSYLVLPSYKYWPRMPIYVYGHSTTESLDVTIEKLGKHELVNLLLVCSGNLLYVGSQMRTLDELDEYTEFVRTIGQVPEPKVGVIPPMVPYSSLIKKIKAPIEPLKPLELRIIGSLYKNARKPVAEIADELNVSSRTVNRHLDNMIAHEKVFFTITFLPTTTGDLFSLYHIKFKEDIEKNIAMDRLLKKFGPRIIFFMPFSNLPHESVAVTWSTSMQALEELQREVENEEIVLSSKTNLIYRGHKFDTWVDNKLFDAIKALDKK